MKTNGTVLRTICLIFFLLASFIAVSGSNCLAKGLPSNFVGIFLPSTPNNGANELIYVNGIVNLAKSYNINVINLIVDWKDLEPTENALQLENLHALVAAIQNQGCFVILRIYANASDNHQAWPIWLQQRLIDDYVYKSVLNPLPWDAAYKSAFHSFLVRFNNWFVQKNQAFPDAIQITAGGSFGEQVLQGYDNQEFFNQYGGDWLAFRTTLWSAETEHVGFFVNDLVGINGELSLMVNSLLPNDQVKNASVGSDAKKQGVRWMQTNAGICNLKYRSDGQENIDLLKYINAPIILEDENSASFACADVGHPEAKPVAERLKLINDIEQANNIKFGGIILNVNDLIESNRAGIAQMLLRGGGTPASTLSFNSAAALDGWILESGETTGKGGGMNSVSNLLIVGDNASNRQYRSILHFNTSAIPDDAIITRAKIGLIRRGIAGVNPFTTHRKLLIDIKKGPFSGNGAMQLTDFQAAAHANGTGNLIYDAATKAYECEFGANTFPFINKLGSTQFRLRFTIDDDNDYVADQVLMYSGNDTNPLNRPVLLIEYTKP